MRIRTVDSGCTISTLVSCLQLWQAKGTVPRYAETHPSRPISKLTIITAELAADFSVWLKSEETKFLQHRLLYVDWDVDDLLGMRERIEGKSAHCHCARMGLDSNEDVVYRGEFRLYYPQTS